MGIVVVSFRQKQELKMSIAIVGIGENGSSTNSIYGFSNKWTCSRSVPGVIYVSFLGTQ